MGLSWPRIPFINTRFVPDIMFYTLEKEPGARHEACLEDYIVGLGPDVSLLCLEVANTYFQD